MLALYSSISKVISYPKIVQECCHSNLIERYQAKHYGHGINKRV
jgi:hypothetical protein